MITGASMRNSIEQFATAGFVVMPALLPAEQLHHLNAVARRQLEECREPLELEADLRYPGAPLSRDDTGGETVRRLLDAAARDPSFAACALLAPICSFLREYFGEEPWMSQVHHNCLMTKHPRYGSMTGWHRDIRFWSFAREDLVSSWIALGEEDPDNGGLWFIPASHRVELGAGSFDAGKFFRADAALNAPLIAAAQPIHLAPGDAVLFHSNTLHSAGQNLTGAVKFSLAFTYHAGSNRPLPGTRSASRPELALNTTAKR